MPRWTPGIAVSIESELVTIPSSLGLRSTLYRSQASASTLTLAPAAVVLELVPVLIFMSAVNLHVFLDVRHPT